MKLVSPFTLRPPPTSASVSSTFMQPKVTALALDMYMLLNQSVETFMLAT
jgi:hypothetical protein